MAEESATRSPSSPPSTSRSSNDTPNPSSVPISSNDHIKPSPVPTMSGFPVFASQGLAGGPNSNNLQMYPIMYPALVPGLIPFPNQDQINGSNNQGRGVYMVPVLPFMGPMAGLPSDSLIPLTYNIPTRANPTEGGVNGAGQGQEGRQQEVPQRQVVIRRFQFGFQIDLLLILKLAVVVFMFNQDGSRERLFFLLLFASIIYLYQTGALTPLMRWLSQGVQREMAGRAPPQQAPAARAEGENVPVPDEQAGGENENQQEPARAPGMNVWGIMKEIKLIVIGFLTSLLPGFHNVD